MLKAGDPAPEFSLYSDEMQLVDMSDLLDQMNVLLLFFPGAFSSVCTEELQKASDDLPWYAGRNTRVVGISTDSTLVLAHFKKLNGIQFPLLSDHSAEVAELYGCKYDHDFTPMKLDRIAKRSAYFIDAGGIIRYSEVHDNPDIMPDFARIRAVARELDI